MGIRVQILGSKVSICDLRFQVLSFRSEVVLVLVLRFEGLTFRV